MSKAIFYCNHHRTYIHQVLHLRNLTYTTLLFRYKNNKLHTQIILPFICSLIPSNHNQLILPPPSLSSFPLILLQGFHSSPLASTLLFLTISVENNPWVIKYWPTEGQSISSGVQRASVGHIMHSTVQSGSPHLVTSSLHIVFFLKVKLVSSLSLCFSEITHHAPHFTHAVIIIMLLLPFFAYWWCVFEFRGSACGCLVATYRNYSWENCKNLAWVLDNSNFDLNGSRWEVWGESPMSLQFIHFI